MRRAWPLCFKSKSISFARQTQIFWGPRNNFPLCVKLFLSLGIGTHEATEISPANYGSFIEKLYLLIIISKDFSYISPDANRRIAFIV